MIGATSCGKSLPCRGPISETCLSKGRQGCLSKDAASSILGSPGRPAAGISKMENDMTENIEKITGEIETLAAELADLAKEGREAEIASRLSETKTRWSEEALDNHEWEQEVARSEYLHRSRRLREGDMDLRTDEEIRDLARAAKTRSLTFDAAYDAVIGHFFDDLDDDGKPVAIPPDHWRAHRARQLVMEVYQPRQRSRG